MTNIIMSVSTVLPVLPFLLLSRMSLQSLAHRHSSLPNRCTDLQGRCSCIMSSLNTSMERRLTQSLSRRETIPFPKPSPR
ncbi:hypothetical protein C8J57DRAFT_1311081 [Mycena rebaudengoi]|nr:hypothetical protein C8J57DRAFT_1311081 [Mycena rebaudengoi]